MIHGVKISASVVCANWMRLEEDLRALERNNVDYVHYDIMDGFFCQDFCMGTQIIQEIRRNTRLPGDYHLMVEEPARILNSFAPGPQDILTIHYEACRNLHRDLMQVKRLGCRVGLALNPATALEAIEYVIEEVDVIMIMTVNPGYAGQKLVPQTLKKIEILRDLRAKDKLRFEISVDGNVGGPNIPQMVAAGADMLVGGSSGLFSKDCPLDESFRRLAELIAQGKRP
jgi:ribulose-phosphate 3-epimerase